MPKAGVKLSSAGEAYQSSLLTRFVRQPGLPSTSSIHSALNYERANGWPSLGPVRQAGNPPTGLPPQQRNAPHNSGIPRPSTNKFKGGNTKTQRGSSYGPPNPSRPKQNNGKAAKYAF